MTVVNMNYLSIKTSMDKKQLHRLHKNYTSIENESRLKAPSNNIVYTILNIFVNDYKNYLHKKKRKYQLTECVKNNNTIKLWLDELLINCIEHKMYTVEQLLIYKIFNKLFSTTPK